MIIENQCTMSNIFILVFVLCVCFILYEITSLTYRKVLMKRVDKIIFLIKQGDAKKQKNLNYLGAYRQTKTLDEKYKEKNERRKFIENI